MSCNFSHVGATGLSFLSAIRDQKTQCLTLLTHWHWDKGIKLLLPSHEWQSWGNPQRAWSSLLKNVRMWPNQTLHQNYSLSVLFFLSGLTVRLRLAQRRHNNVQKQYYKTVLSGTHWYNSMSYCYLLKWQTNQSIWILFWRIQAQEDILYNLLNVVKKKSGL